MQLLVAVVNQEEKVAEVLSGFLELGITGATVVDSVGMGRLLRNEAPIFADVEAIAAPSRPRNQTVFSVIDDDAKVDAAIALLQDVCGDFGEPGRGLVFTVPVSRALGLAREIGGG